MSSKYNQIAHTNKYEEKSPPWVSVSNNLPPEAFAVVENKDDQKTWLYPHHYVLAGSKPTNEGYPTVGDLILHSEQFYKASAQATKDGNTKAMAHFAEHMKAVDPDGDGSFLPNKVGIMNYSQKMVSKHAFNSPVISFDSNEVPEATDGRARVKIVALSGEILDRPEWGPCVQDLSGMMHSSKIVIDHKHNDCELLGYVDTFDTSTGQLVLEGMMIPQQTHKRVEEIIANQHAGMPYEASIYFPPSTPEDLEIEFVEGGKPVTVNGKSFAAPEAGLTIFRKWVLRGIAICPHGADRQTEAYLQKATEAEKIAVNIKRKDHKMDEQKEAAPEAEAKATLEASTQQAAAEPTPPAEEGHEDEGEDRKLFKKLMDRFGSKKGGAEFVAKHFMKGSSYEAALEAYVDEDKEPEEVAEKFSQAAPDHVAVVKPAVKFAQSTPASSTAMIDGVPAKFAQKIHDEAMKQGLSAEYVKIQMDIARKEFEKQKQAASEEIE